MIGCLLTVMLLMGQAAPGAETGATEAEALVERIRVTLAGIDDALLEAPDADDLAQALDQLVSAHEQVVRDLEELIAQAKYRAGQQGGGGGGGQSNNPPPSGSPPPPPPRESDGSQSEQQQGGEQPQSPQEREQQAQGEQQPHDGPPPPANSEGQDRQGGPPPPDPLSDPTRKDIDGRWGLLPPKVQERLQNLHVDDVPERYRHWLSAYVRALSAVEQEEGGR